MRGIVRLISLLMLWDLIVGCTSEHSGRANVPFDEWYFSFTTPKALPAQVTLVKLLDMNGYGYVFQTIDQPQGNSVGQWAPRAGVGITSFNKAKAPPQLIIFCWDSIIDKKVYETSLFFHSDTQKKMLSSEPSWQDPKELYYFQHMVIGLAPEGKVRVWLKNNGQPNLEQTSTEITTVSGKGLDMCKSETNFPNGYEYSEKMKSFIQGKTYPYGSW